jgi:hypothetical protein
MARVFLSGEQPYLMIEKYPFERNLMLSIGREPKAHVILRMEVSLRAGMPSFCVV